MLINLHKKTLWQTALYATPYFTSPAPKDRGRTNFCWNGLIFMYDSFIMTHCFNKTVFFDTTLDNIATSNQQ